MGCINERTWRAPTPIFSLAIGHKHKIIYTKIESCFACNQHIKAKLSIKFKNLGRSLTSTSLSHKWESNHRIWIYWFEYLHGSPFPSSTSAVWMDNPFSGNLEYKSPIYRTSSCPFYTSIWSPFFSIKVISYILSMEHIFALCGSFSLFTFSFWFLRIWISKCSS